MFDLLRKMFAFIGLGLILLKYFKITNNVMTEPIIHLCIWLMFLMTALSKLKKKQTNIALMYFSVLGLILIVEAITLIR